LQQLTTIKKALAQLKPELVRHYHVRTIGLFGSVVRNDFSSASDIDIC
jgi:predicted nucleotidyltransferase